jgi:hypothetical protein
MNDRDKVKLLFGPYKAPHLKVGDRTLCLYRDKDLIITSWMDAGRKDNLESIFRCQRML